MEVLTAVIVWKSIKHYEREKYSKEHLQATSITIEEKIDPLTICAAYCPPDHKDEKNSVKNISIFL